MAAIPDLKRIIVDRLPSSVRTWVGTEIATPVNGFMDSVVRALRRELTLNENLAAEIRKVELDGTMPLNLVWTLSAKPRAVLVGAAYRKDGTAVALTNAVYVRWQFNSAGQLQLDQVVGVTPTPAARWVLELVTFTG